MDKQREDVELVEVAEEERSAFNFLSSFFDIWEVLVSCLVATLLILSFVFMSASVIGDSMKNTLFETDRLIASSMFHKLSKGKIVIVNECANSIVGHLIVKRIVATEGDSVEIKKGKLFVNGVEQKESYIHDATLAKSRIKYPLVVPKGHVFVLGDNRMNSTDSRDLGCISKEHIKGVALLLVRWKPFSFKLL